MNTNKTAFTLVLFLLGIFMGAIDSGIISPAREIIQNSFGVQRNIGMWMITIYTLSYAISMPIVSKLADRYGRKKVYIWGIAIFGLGSLLCGLTNFYGSFSFFLVSRVIQAIGAGGILPIATTVIGQSFPEEKRGMALGLVGAVYGIATILGPTLGSAILDLSGINNWGWLFFINVPISLIIIALSTKAENSVSETTNPMDIWGALLVGGVVGSLMYALTNINFFNLSESIKSREVFPFLIASALLIPILIIIETKAKDPVLNMKYFKSNQMILIFILALLVGTGMMGMIFVPQFAENVLKLKAGSGGYVITILAVFSGIAAPISGKLLDKKGAKFVLLLGFLFNAAGTLFLGYYATSHQNFISILIGVAFMGLGVGFTIGAPLNYLVLQTVPTQEGATAIATMSLMRSIGVAISPSIMIGFVIDAAKGLPSKLMVVVSEGLSSFMPKGMSLNNITGSSGGEAFKNLQNSDITTIVDALKNSLKSVLPPQAQGIVLNGVENLRQSIENTFQTTMNLGYSNMFRAIAIIAFIGLFTTIFLTNKKVDTTEKI